MKLKFLLMFILCTGLVSAISVCIDHSDPSAPSNLTVSGSSGAILLEWAAAEDKPSCSGIDYYNISRDGNWTGTVNGSVLEFIDNDSLSAGEYIYTVYAVDLVGHNVGSAVKNVIEITISGDVSRGSSYDSFECIEDWSCGEWSDCVGNDMRRICSDLNKCGTDKDKPEVYQECELETEDKEMVLESIEEESNTSEINNGFFSAITGAVIGGGTTSFAVAGGFVVLALGGFFLVKFRR